MDLLLIRHGQTPNNVAGSLDTAFPGAGLTGLGEQQSRALPGALEGRGISAIYVSPLLRTQLTAGPLASSLGQRVTVVPGLEEIGAGDLEMRSDPASVEAYAGCVLGWMRGNLDRRMPGGTTGHEFVERFDAAVRGLLHHHGPQESVAVVSHGAAIRVHTAHATSLPPARARELTLQNTGMSVLSGSPDEGWILDAWHAEPLGGTALEDTTEHDVTGSAP